MVKKIGSRTLFLGLLFLAILMTQSASGHGIRYPLMGFVVNAYYDDVDGNDDVEDIVWTVFLKSREFKGRHGVDSFDGASIAVLEYPNGTTSWYVIFTTIYQPFVWFNLIFYNHATSSGWYRAHLFSMANTTYNENIQGTNFLDNLGALLDLKPGHVRKALPTGVHYHSHCFDPPGGVGGTPPMLGIMLFGGTDFLGHADLNKTPFA